MAQRNLPRYPHCFVCGRKNVAGLDLTFQAVDGGVRVETAFPDRYIGFSDRVHGGILSAVLDEAMGWSCTVRTGRMYFTSELKVRFKKPVAAEQPVRIEASCGEIRRWVARATGRLIGSDGELCVESEGVFCAVPADYFNGIIDLLETDTRDGPRPARPEDLMPGADG